MYLCTTFYMMVLISFYYNNEFILWEEKLVICCEELFIFPVLQRIIYSQSSYLDCLCRFLSFNYQFSLASCVNFIFEFEKKDNKDYIVMEIFINFYYYCCIFHVIELSMFYCFYFFLCNCWFFPPFHFVELVLAWLLKILLF